MTLYDFKLLSMGEQAEIAWGSPFAGEIKKAGRNFMLYLVSDFYVEVCYNPEENTIEEIKSFTLGGPIDLYLEQISLDSLLA